MFNNPPAKFDLAVDADAASQSLAEILGVSNGQPFDAPEWHEGGEEGQLAVDVAQTAEELIVTATMAGTAPEDIRLHLHNDLLTIRGERHPLTPPDAEYFYQECYWGKFSRTIVLPVEVSSESARAEYKNGVLTVRLNKAKSDSNIPIFVVEEDET